MQNLVINKIDTITLIFLCYIPMINNQCVSDGILVLQALARLPATPTYDRINKLHMSYKMQFINLYLSLIRFQGHCWSKIRAIAPLIWSFMVLSKTNSPRWLRGCESDANPSWNRELSLDEIVWASDMMTIHTFEMKIKNWVSNNSQTSLIYMSLCKGKYIKACVAKYMCDMHPRKCIFATVNDKCKIQLYCTNTHANKPAEQCIIIHDSW